MQNDSLNNFIYGKEKRLQLLTFASQDISHISQLLGEITLDLMDQCYKHTVEFDEYNKKKNKKYNKIKKQVKNQLKDLLFIQKEFIQKFLQLGKKTKEELYEYVYAYQMYDLFYDQYLYRVLIKSLKQEFPENFWIKHDLRKHLVGHFKADNYTLYLDTKQEISTGRVNFNFQQPLAIIDKYVNDFNKKNKTITKLDLIKEIGNVVNNYPYQKVLLLHMPFKDSINNLVDDIKVSLDLEKAKIYKKIY